MVIVVMKGVQCEGHDVELVGVWRGSFGSSISGEPRR